MYIHKPATTNTNFRETSSNVGKWGCGTFAQLTRPPLDEYCSCSPSSQTQGVQSSYPFCVHVCLWARFKLCKHHSVIPWNSATSHQSLISKSEHHCQRLSAPFSPLHRLPPVTGGLSVPFLLTLYTVYPTCSLCEALAAKTTADTPVKAATKLLGSVTSAWQTHHGSNRNQDTTPRERLFIVPSLSTWPISTSSKFTLESSSAHVDGPKLGQQGAFVCRIFHLLWRFPLTRPCQGTRFGRATCEGLAEKQKCRSETKAAIS